MSIPEFPCRAWLPDQMKGWAVWWMILVHSIELFLNLPDRGSPVAQFALFMGAVPAAPVFMLLMGYYAIRPGQTFKANIYRGAKLILWGLLLNIGLNFSLILRWATGHADVNILEFIFGIDILLFAGAAVLIASLIDLLKIRWPVWLLLALAVPAINQWIVMPLIEARTTAIGSPYVTALFAGTSSWSYFPVIPWISYVFAGIGLYRLFSRWPGLLIRSRYHFFAAIPAVAIFLAGLVPAWKMTQQLDQYYHHGFLFFVWAMSFILLLFLNVQAMQKGESIAFSKVIRFLGVRVTSVYIIQWILIGNLGTWLYQSLSLPATLLVFALVFLTTLFFALLYHKQKSP